MRLLNFVFLTTLVALTAAAPSQSYYVLHEKRQSTHAQWEKRDRLLERDILSMRIGLVQRDLHRGHELLMDVSDPRSPYFGKHYTAEEVADLFAPASSTINTVRDWLVSAGIRSESIVQTSTKAWLAFNATVAQVETLFKTEYFVYRNDAHGFETIACEEYHLPQHIQNHVDYISPGVKLASSKLRRTLKRDLSISPNFKAPTGQIGSNQLATCDVVMTPECISALYHIPPATKAVPGNDLGIFERGDWVSGPSLDLFFKNFTKIPIGTRPNRVNIDNYGNEFGNETTQDHGEADLDFQLAYPIVYPQNITQYQVDDLYYSGYGQFQFTGTFNTFLDALDGSYCNYSAFGETGDDPTIDPPYPNFHTIGDLPPAGDWMEPLMCGTYKPTNVISFSYGHAEDYYPYNYQQRQCNEFLKLGLQGVSLIVSSGDRGVAEDTGCLGANQTIFSPSYPANCPWITAVGATEVYPGKTIYEPESAVWDPSLNYYSGGGFSNVYFTPDYQKDAVEHFFKYHNPPYPYYEGNTTIGANGGLYNRVGRGSPDVSANGLNIATYVQETFTLGSGTSASTPIFASIINRINGERLSIGKGPLGFLNPSIYANPSMFNDITNGTNPGCGTAGFSATEGWDPVTGLGTPNYPRMLEYYLSLP